MPQACLNCDQELIANAQHCSQCGQKVKIQHLSFWSIVSDFFSNLFNVEAKIWRTLRDIWKPARLTIAFISGKRVMYYNPIRIFIITLFTFFALFLFNIRDSFQSIDATVNSKKQEIWKLNLAEDYDSLSVKYNWPKEINEKIKNELLTPQAIQEEKLTIDIAGDSVRYTDPPIRDSLEGNIDTSNISERADINLKYASEDSLVSFDLGQGTVIDDITINDLFRLSAEELEEKVKDESWQKKVFVLQIQKVFINFSSMLQFFVGNGTWLTIALILLISAFFKLIYYRHNYLYAEHFIFHVYGHTRLLLLAIIGILLEIFILHSNVWYLPWFVIGVIYLYAGMKTFYKQSILKTMIKLLITITIYFIFILLCLALVFGLSFLFF